jgi:hypothetical protein
VRGDLDVLPDREVGYEVIELEDEAQLATAMLPPSTSSRPPMRFRKVDLPEPEGPSMTQISPLLTLAVMPSRTWTRASPSP